MNPLRKLIARIDSKPEGWKVVNCVLSGYFLLALTAAVRRYAPILAYLLLVPISVLMAVALVTISRHPEHLPPSMRRWFK